jgi:hypothetical protein
MANSDSKKDENSEFRARIKKIEDQIKEEFKNSAQKGKLSEEAAAKIQSRDLPSGDPGRSSPYSQPEEDRKKKAS